MRGVATWVAVALAGALVALLSLIVATNWRSALVMDMDRELPAVTSGLYASERNGDETFAWTSAVATIRLTGLDRGAPWECAILLRGSRPDTLPQPEVRAAVDGVVVGSRRATNAYEPLVVVAPARPGSRGLVLSLASSPTFVPGPGDPRELGVQVDRLECRREAGLPAWPPLAAVGASTLGSGVFSLLATLGPWNGAAGILAGSIGLAAALTSGVGLHAPGYLLRMSWLAAWCLLAVIVALLLARRWPLPDPVASVPAPFGLSSPDRLVRARSHAPSRATTFVLLFSAGIVLLKLAALLHPSKLVIDALFNAHRLEWVLAGRYYFTQPMPSGVSFPYAIGLYVVAAPFTWLTDDYVMLLRTVVCVAEALAGLLVYVMVARSWGDRRAGAVALVLFHLVPLPYLNAGNANLPFAFSQSVAVAAVAAATLWRRDRGHPAQWAGLFLLTSLAFLSHVGTFPVTFALLVGASASFWFLGDRTLRPFAVRLLLVVAGALAFAVVSYYGHFAESYRSLRTVRGETAAGTAATGGEAGGAGGHSRAAADFTADAVEGRAPSPVPRVAVARHERAWRAAELFGAASGWPVVVLALVGTWRAWAGRRRDRLTLVLIAWAAVIAAVIAAAVVAPVDVRFVRYADEFIDRVSYQALPLMAILAALGAVWAWERGRGPRLVTMALVAVSAAGAIERWAGWLR